MKRITFLGCLLFLNVHILFSQTVTTILQNGSGIDESLFRSNNGELYGTGYANGTLNTFSIGSSTEVLDSLDSPSEMTELSNGKIAITESQGDRVVLFDTQNQTEQLLTSAIPNPAGIIKMPTSDTLLVSSTSSNKIYSIAPNGDTSLYLSSNLLNSPVSMLWDDSNNLYIANYSNGTIVKKDSNGAISTFCSLPTSSLGHIIKIGNMIFATGVFSHKVYNINIATAAWSIYAGSTQGSVDGNLTIAQFNSPNGIVASVTGDSIYISEYNTQAIRLIIGVLNTVGLNEIEHQPIMNPIKIWPNPARTNFFVMLESGNKPFKILLFNSNGTIVATDLVAQNYSENSFHVKLPNLPNGLYFLKFTSNSMSQTQKLFISNE